MNYDYHVKLCNPPSYMSDVFFFSRHNGLIQILKFTKVPTVQVFISNGFGNNNEAPSILT